MTKLKLKLAIGLAALLVNGAAVDRLMDGAAPLLGAIGTTAMKAPVPAIRKLKPFAPSPTPL